jgi:hypothetical protein
MSDTALQTGNSAKGFEDLTTEQQERALAMFAPLRPHTDYLYEIDSHGEIRCRRYIGTGKPAGTLKAWPIPSPR